MAENMTSCSQAGRDHPFKVVLTLDPGTQRYDALVTAGKVDGILAPQFDEGSSLATVYDVRAPSRIYLKVTVNKRSLLGVALHYATSYVGDSSSTKYLIIARIEKTSVDGDALHVIQGGVTRHLYHFGYNDIHYFHPGNYNIY